MCFDKTKIYFRNILYLKITIIMNRIIMIDADNYENVYGGGGDDDDDDELMTMLMRLMVMLMTKILMTILKMLMTTTMKLVMTSMRQPPFDGSHVCLGQTLPPTPRRRWWWRKYLV